MSTLGIGNSYFSSWLLRDVFFPRMANSAGGWNQPSGYFTLPGPCGGERGMCSNTDYNDSVAPFTPPCGVVLSSQRQRGLYTIANWSSTPATFNRRIIEALASIGNAIREARKVSKPHLVAF